MTNGEPIEIELAPEETAEDNQERRTFLLPGSSWSDPNMPDPIFGDKPKRSLKERFEKGKLKLIREALEDAAGELANWP